MRTATIIAAAVAAGVVGAGAVVTPVVLAADDDPAPNRYGPRWDDRSGGRGFGPMQEEMREEMGRHLRRGMGRAPGPRAGQGMGGGPQWREGREPGDCPMLGVATRGELTSEQRSRLARQAELEKLSHDVYVVFAERTGDVRFERIAWSETRHLEAIRTLMDRYGVDDPTEGHTAGEFPGALKDDYDAYVEAGSGSLEAALDTAAKIERDDIAGLEKAVERLDAPDVERVYEHLTHASQMHLAAFSR
jgi:hypothetical protein